MKTIFTLCIIVFCSHKFSLAQNNFVREFNVMGDFTANAVLQTQAGDFVIAGYAEENVDRNIALLKLNSAGDTIWTKFFCSITTDEAYDVKETQDGGYVIAGYTSNGSEALLLKTDSSGNLLWAKTYSGTGGIEYISSIDQTHDGGFFLAGQTNSFGNVSSKIYVLRTNASGDTIWTRCMDAQWVDVATSVIATQDGGCFVTGYMHEQTGGNYNLVFVKLDSAGTMQWIKSIDVLDADFSEQVRECSDSGYIILVDIPANVTPTFRSKVTPLNQLHFSTDDACVLTA